MRNGSSRISCHIQAKYTDGTSGQMEPRLIRFHLFAAHFNATSLVRRALRLHGRPTPRYATQCALNHQPLTRLYSICKQLDRYTFHPVWRILSLCPPGPSGVLRWRSIKVHFQTPISSCPSLKQLHPTNQFGTKTKFYTSSSSFNDLSTYY